MRHADVACCWRYAASQSIFERFVESRERRFTFKDGLLAHGCRSRRCVGMGDDEVGWRVTLAADAADRYDWPSGYWLFRGLRLLAFSII